jgi:hypothetical protein
MHHHKECILKTYYSLNSAISKALKNYYLFVSVSISVSVYFFLLDLQILE